jgi:hypothetical protein
MDNSTEILIRLCAKTDAIFSPIRNWTEGIGQRVYLVQKNFQTYGVAWASRERAVASRKAIERSLKTLVGNDSIQVAKPKSGERTLYVRLLDAGDKQARAICDLPSLADAIELMQKMVAFDNHPDQCVDGEWVSDLSLIGQSQFDAVDESNRVAIFETMLTFYPALWRGLVESTSDLSGRVWWRLTSEGRTALSSGVIPSVKKERYRKSQDYFDCREIALKEIAVTQIIDAAEIGLLPFTSSPTTRGMNTGHNLLEVSK